MTAPNRDDDRPLTSVRAKIALDIVSSEHFTWLFCGDPDWSGAHIESLRPLYNKFTTVVNPGPTALARDCFCGSPDDRQRVHRAHECLPWVQRSTCSESGCNCTPGRDCSCRGCRGDYEDTAGGR